MLFPGPNWFTSMVFGNGFKGSMAQVTPSWVVNMNPHHPPSKSNLEELVSSTLKPMYMCTLPVSWPSFGRSGSYKNTTQSMSLSGL